MGLFRADWDGNLESYLDYFLEDDPGTTHRFAFTTHSGKASYLRYDTINGVEYLTARIELTLGAGWTTNGSALTSGTITRIDFWYGDRADLSATIEGVSYDAVTFNALLTDAYSYEDTSFNALGYFLGAQIDRIEGSTDNDVVVQTDWIEPTDIQLGLGDDLVFAGLQASAPIIFSGGLGYDAFHLFDWDDGPFANILDLRDTPTGFGFTDRWGVQHTILADFEEFYGSAGNDIFYLGPLGPLIDGGGGNDVFHDSPIAEIIAGGSGHDTIYSSDGADTIQGGDGDDLIITKGGGSVVNGGGGADTVSVALAEIAASTYDGGEDYSFDVISFADVTAGASTINFLSRSFTDPWGTIHGIANFDAIALSAFDDVVHLAYEIAIDVSLGGNYTIYDSVHWEKISGGDGNDTIISSKGKDTLNGGGGDDFLRVLQPGSEMHGGDGNDFLLLGDDPTILHPSCSAWGGAGNDTFSMRGIGTIYLDDLTHGVLIDFDTGLITGGGDTDRMIDPWGVFGTDFNDTFQGATAERDDGWKPSMRGGLGDDVFYGTSGVIRYWGDEGNDTFYTADGFSFFHGGDGDDTFIVENATTRNSLQGDEGSDLYLVDTLNVNVVDNGRAGTDVLRLTKAWIHDPAQNPFELSHPLKTVEIIEGSDVADHLVLDWSIFYDPIIRGMAGDDVLEIAGLNLRIEGGEGDDALKIVLRDTRAASGADTLDGGTGIDTMDGIGGADTYIVDNPLDVVRDTGTDAAIDTILIRGADGFDFTGVDWTGVERVMAEDPAVILDARTYSGDAALSGADGKDTILGGAAGARIEGGAGADVLIGDGGLAEYQALFGDLTV